MSERDDELGLEILSAVNMARIQTIDTIRHHRIAGGRGPILVRDMEAWTQIATGAQVLGMDALGMSAEDLADRCQRALHPAPDKERT